MSSAISPDDLIKREDALKAIVGSPNDLHYPGWYIDAIKGVPGVEQKVVIKMEAVATGLTFTPNKPIGKWVWVEVENNDNTRRLCCSQCGNSAYDTTRFCPHCGAKMEETE